MTYRVGDHHGVTIVREGDGARCDRPDHDCARGHLVGVMLTAEDAALVVSMLNRDGCTRVGLHNCAGEWRNHDRYEADSCTCSPLPGGADPGCPVHQGRRARGPAFDERLDVRRRIDQQAEHRPSSLGDGFGYGPCVGCGQLWPCAASRGEGCTCPWPGLPSRTCPRHGAVM